MQTIWKFALRTVRCTDQILLALTWKQPRIVALFFRMSLENQKLWSLFSVTIQFRHKKALQSWTQHVPLQVSCIQLQTNCWSYNLRPAFNSFPLPVSPPVHSYLVTNIILMFDQFYYNFLNQHVPNQSRIKEEFFWGVGTA